MVNIKQIKVDEQVKSALDEMKVHPREPYNDVLKRMLKQEGHEISGSLPARRSPNLNQSVAPQRASFKRTSAQSGKGIENRPPPDGGGQN